MRQRVKPAASLKKKLFFAGAGFILLVFLIASLFGERGLIEVYQAQQKRDSLIRERTLLLDQKQKLIRDIKELRDNPEAVEEKAREKLWLMKPDELVIIFR
jgi:cell division protein FtsB